MDILFYLTLTLASIVGLTWSADRLIGVGIQISHRLKTSPMFIGFTVLAFGTSLPEIMVSISGSLQDAGILAVGNAIGSNLANIGLVFAITIIATTAFVVPSVILRRYLPIFLGVTIWGGILLWDLHLTVWDGLLLLAVLPLPLWIFLRDMHLLDTPSTPSSPHNSSRMIYIWFILFLILVNGSSQVLVWGASRLALELNVSDFLIGLSVVAIGTSLPELAVSISGVRSRQYSMVIGNIIGSNIFNLLIVMAIPGLLAPLTLETQIVQRDYIAMAVLSGLFAIILYYRYWRSDGEQVQITRVHGIVLLLLYVIYYGVIFNHVR